MKTVSIFVAFATFLLFNSSCLAQTLDEELRRIPNNTLAKLPGGAAKIAEAIRERRKADGCDPNLCFAIDGSAQLGQSDFNLQKDFLAIVTAIVGADERAHFSGVQYGLRNKVIRNIRGNANDFLLDIEKIQWLRSRRSFIGGGVAYCNQQLRRRRGEPAKMVVFGDGRSSYGRLTGPLGPAAVAENFRSLSPANLVCTVAVGFSRTDLFLDIVDGDRNLVLKVTEWHKVLEILRDLVADICGVTTIFRR